MASQLSTLFRTSGRQVLDQFLQVVIGQSWTVLGADAYYRKRVVDPAWQALPLPLRMLGRERLRWDELFDELRDAVYDTAGEQVAFQPDAAARTAALFEKAAETVERMVSDSGTADAGTARPAASASAAALTPPGPATAAQSQAVLGIDLGTTYSAVAWIDGQGRPSCLPNSVGDLLTPSIVLFDDDGAVVGKEAAMAAAMEPDRIAVCVKRDMGSKAYSRKINGEYLPPEVIASIVLRSLKSDAERRLGPVSQAVITVPAYFDEPRRQATIDAGRLAGLDVLDIINEPTAAALSYGYQIGFLDRQQGAGGDRPLRIMVYDLGGGTFDVTILEIHGTDFKAVATDGDVRLGGKDWDEKLVDLAADRFLAKHREDPRTHPSSLQELWAAAETAKKTLSERPRGTMYVNHLGTRMKVEVTREEFEDATAGLVDRTRQTTEIVLRQAVLTWNEIDRLLLVGGSTRMPMIVRMLEELSGKPADRSLSPDEAVAHGAALYADLLLHRRAKDGAKPRFTLTNVNSHSLGIVAGEIQTGQKINHILIPRNTPLPCSVTKSFKTARAGQSSVKVAVLEGESTRPEYCTQVGVSVIRNLPPDLPAGWPVLVSYRYGEDGRLQVTARVKDHDAAAAATFARDNHLPEDDLLAWSEFVTHESRLLSK